MQPMQLCFNSSRPFWEAFENFQSPNIHKCIAIDFHFHSFKILGQIQQIRDILLSPPPSLAIWLKDGWISIQPFWGRWWEIQPIPGGIFIHWMDFHLMVGIPSTLVRFPTTWMEIHPLGLVGPDVAVKGFFVTSTHYSPALTIDILIY